MEALQNEENISQWSRQPLNLWLMCIYFMDVGKKRRVKGTCILEADARCSRTMNLSEKLTKS